MFTPADRANARLPVMFFIHGGAFATGARGVAAYLDPEGLCSREVVLVSCNHRPNLFGFFTHPWLDDEAARAIRALGPVRGPCPGCAQHCRLRGDPDNITLFGQSAGAVSVQAWITSPLTRGWGQGHPAQRRRAQGHGRGPARVPGAQGGPAFDRPDGARNLAELRAVPAEDLAALARQGSEQGPRCATYPTLTDDSCPTDFTGGALLGQIHDIPLMLGYTAQELNALGGLSGMSSVKDRPGLRPSGQAAASLGPRAVLSIRFRSAATRDSRGAYHMAELWYVFGTLALLAAVHAWG